MEENKSPFTHYREGFVDGYFGNPLEHPDDAHYTAGYLEGSEADRTGEPCKYGEEKYVSSHDSPSPVKPSQCR